MCVYIYVCVCVYIYIYIHIYVYKYMYVCVCMSTRPVITVGEQLRASFLLRWGKEEREVKEVKEGSEVK